MSGCVGVVLAAGRASRAGGNKALARLGGATYLERTVRALRGAGATPIVVVVAEPHGAQIERALPAGCVAVRNDAPERGMLGSLQVGLAHAVALAGQDRGLRVVVSLIDHPRVRATTVRALLDALDDGAIASRPRHRGRRGHPYAITGAAIDALRTASLDRSARDVLRALGCVDRAGGVSGGPARDVDVDDAGVLDDLDVPRPRRGLSLPVPVRSVRR